MLQFWMLISKYPRRTPIACWVALLAVSCLCTLVSTSTVTGNATVPGDARMLSDAETDYGTTWMLPTRKCWQRDEIALVLN